MNKSAEHITELLNEFASTRNQRRRISIHAELSNMIKSTSSGLNECELSRDDALISLLGHILWNTAPGDRHRIPELEPVIIAMCSREDNQFLSSMVYPVSGY